MTQDKKEKEEKITEAEKSTVKQNPNSTMVEWAVRAVALLLILGLLSFFTYQCFEPSKETNFSFTILEKEIKKIDGNWVLPVEITNNGSKSLHNLRVGAMLKKDVDSTSFSGEKFKVKLFGSKETRRAEFWFDKDPIANEVKFNVISYEVP